MAKKISGLLSNSQQSSNVFDMIKPHISCFLNNKSTYKAFNAPYDFYFIRLLLNLGQTLPLNPFLNLDIT
ncbi:hypothetical protein FUAX_27120 [Fulvitalea axinellae]|uniref:Uncharacterized protein n=1 Tax=Fulvitalea axinellae TaxID=1182444 RepID=A0AAU9CLU0_9BACT|nr:hypothetical protein FUAX_27120 [Fulvitalea axinellae]